MLQNMFAIWSHQIKLKYLFCIKALAKRRFNYSVPTRLQKIMWYSTSSIRGLVFNCINLKIGCLLFSYLRPGEGLPKNTAY